MARLGTHETVRGRIIAPIIVGLARLAGHEYSRRVDQALWSGASFEPHDEQAHRLFCLIDELEFASTIAPYAFAGMALDAEPSIRLDAARAITYLYRNFL